MTSVICSAATEAECNVVTGVKPANAHDCATSCDGSPRAVLEYSDNDALAHSVQQIDWDIGVFFGAELMVTLDQKGASLTALGCSFYFIFKNINQRFVFNSHEDSLYFSELFSGYFDFP